MAWEILKTTITAGLSNRRHIMAIRSICRNHHSSTRWIWTKIQCCLRRTCRLRNRWDPKQVWTEGLNRDCHPRASTSMATRAKAALFRKSNWPSTQKVKTHASTCKSTPSLENWHPKQKVKWAKEPWSKDWYNPNASISTPRPKPEQPNNLTIKHKTTAAHSRHQPPSIHLASPSTTKTWRRTSNTK